MSVLRAAAPAGQLTVQLYNDVLRTTGIVQVYEWLTGENTSTLPSYRNASKLVSCPNLDHPIKRGGKRDAHPSCSLQPDLNVFRCFSCGAKGGIFDLIILAGKATTASGAADWLRAGERAPLQEQMSLPRRIRGLRKLRDEIAAGCWPYVDLDGELLYQVLRYEGYDERGIWSKRFLQRRPYRDTWIWHLGASCKKAEHPDCPCHWKGAADARKSVKRVPYRWPEIHSAARDGRTVFWLEGEKCADAAVLLGLNATTHSGGSNAQVGPEWCHYLAGVGNLIRIPDCDLTGRETAVRHLELVRPVVKRAIYVDLDPARTNGYDLYDWRSEQLRRGYSKDQMVNQLHAIVQAGAKRPLPVFTTLEAKAS